MDEIDKVLDLWNSVYPQDPTTREVLLSKFFDSNYIEIVGPIVDDASFSLACVRRSAFHYSNDMNDGWILGLGYTKKESARFLLENQIYTMKKRGIKTLYYSSFTPDYFSPGVDRARYPTLYDFLVENGFRPESVAIEMSLDLNSYRYSIIDSDSPIMVQAFREDLKEPLLRFVKGNFNPDWFHRVSVVSEFGEREQVAVASYRSEIVGFSMFSGSEGPHWYSPGERFGPFGVSEAHRSNGIGTMLLKQTLNMMKGRGIQSAYFKWTDEKAGRLYSRFGFRETRRYSILRLDL